MLKIASINLHLDFLSPAHFPRWLGSTFRGGVGEYLRRICCPKMETDCFACSENVDCPHFQIYTKREAKKGHAPPTRPIIVIPPFFGKEMNVERNAKLKIRVIMFGDYIKYLPHMLLAFRLLGSEGFGSYYSRKQGLNRFIVSGIECSHCGENIYNGQTIDIARLHAIDVKDIPRFESDHFRLGFYTPLYLKTGDFAPNPFHLLKLIRQRLILYVNEYGDASSVEEYKCNGSVKTLAAHHHILEGRSRRQGIRKFIPCYTGEAEYQFEESCENAKWLTSVGLVIGAGPKSSFGCGFINLNKK